jgi:hypothetical protein
MTVEEVDAAAGSEDEDVVIAGGESLRAGMIGELIVEGGALEAAGGEAESGWVGSGWGGCGVDEVEAADGIRRCFGFGPPVFVMGGLVRGLVEDLELSGLEVDDRAIVTIDSDDVDDDFAGSDVEGEEAGFALGGRLGLRGGGLGLSLIVRGRGLEEQGRQQEGWKHRSTPYNDVETGERSGKFRGLAR